MTRWMNIGALALAAQLAAGLSVGMMVGCAGTSNKEGARTAADENSELPPGEQPPPGSEAKPQPAMQMQAQAPKQPKLSASERADFDAVVKRWEADLKAGPLARGECSSLASKFEHVASSHEKLAAQAYFNAGTLYENCSGDKDAEEAYNKALQANPSYSFALSNLGEIAYRRGNQQQAREYFEKAIAADPTHNASAYNNLALIIYNQAQQSNDPAGLNDAIGKLRRALAIDNDSMPAYALLALIYYTEGQHSKAKLELAELVIKQAKEVNDKYAPIYNTEGLIKLRKKNVTGALKEFEQAVQYDPKYVEAYLNIGAIGLSSRQYAKAQHAFETVLRLQPNNVDATIGLGVALRGQKQFDQAEAQYKKAAQLDPKSCAVPYNLGLLYQDYKSSPDYSNLHQAQGFYRQYLQCGNTMPSKVEDANRRIKDIDDTFAAIEQQKQAEAQMKAMEEQQKQQMEQMKKQQEEQQKNAPPAPGGAAGGGAAAPKTLK